MLNSVNFLHDSCRIVDVYFCIETTDDILIPPGSEKPLNVTIVNKTCHCIHIIKDTSIRSFQNAFLTTVPLNLDKYINE